MFTKICDNALNTFNSVDDVIKTYAFFLFNPSSYIFPVVYMFYAACFDNPFAIYITIL